ncbi:MAG: N-6 DNA methylase [Phycisphaerae bacterium]|jgi:adenine-specific DNA-methyltransferase
MSCLEKLKFEIPEPQTGERPVDYAYRLGELYCLNSSAEKKKENGQYFTPVEIADLMARQITQKNDTVRILDPGAGTGILGCALCEHLASQPQPPVKIELISYETDKEILYPLKKAVVFLKQYIEKKGLSFDFQIKEEDFILKYAHNIQNTPSFFNQNKEETKYDICISNPPYFKLSKADPRAFAASDIVHGQPNIYSLFMATAISVLKTGGEMIFITPRSFTSGNYFRLFREKFLKLAKPEFIHLFDSRKDTFKKDGVLQENIILKAKRLDNWQADPAKHSIVISSCGGINDIESAIKTEIPLTDVVDLSTNNKILKVPNLSNGENIFVKFGSFHGTLKEYELKISTGPVVAFRAEKFFCEENIKQENPVPLLWLHNLKAMKITWPLYKKGKLQYIKNTPESSPLLIKNNNYVLLRRFSTKEEPRRLVASPFIGRLYPYDYIGLENHINYIHKPNGVLKEEEAWGLAVLYNSSYYDNYFRDLNGSTQVSATEINSIPLPPLEVIVEIGKMAMSNAEALNDIDLLADIAFNEATNTEGVLVNV